MREQSNAGGGVAMIESRRDPYQRQIEARLQALADANGATFISMLDLECPGGKCALVDPAGDPLRRDYGHLTLPGARWAVSRLPDLARFARSETTGEQP